jgi:phage gp29-like protein
MPIGSATTNVTTLEQGTTQGAQSDFQSSLPFYKSLGMTDAQAYQQWIKDNKDQTTATQQKQLADLQNSDSQLVELEQAIKDHSGYFGTIAGPVGNFVNGISPDANRSALNTQLQAVVQQTARGLEGGKMSDKDFQRYAAYLPSMNDSPDSAVAKIESLRKMIASNLQGYQSQYGTGSTTNSDLSLLQ